MHRALSLRDHYLSATRKVLADRGDIVWVLATAIIVALLVGLAMGRANNPSEAWWSGILSNLPTSLLAVILGIPIALRVAQLGGEKWLRFSEQPTGLR